MIRYVLQHKLWFCQKEKKEADFKVAVTKIKQISVSKLHGLSRLKENFKDSYFSAFKLWIFYFVISNAKYTNGNMSVKFSFSRSFEDELWKVLRKTSTERGSTFPFVVLRNCRFHQHRKKPLWVNVVILYKLSSECSQNNIYSCI